LAFLSEITQRTQKRPLQVGGDFRAFELRASELCKRAGQACRSPGLYLLVGQGRISQHAGAKSGNVGAAGHARLCQAELARCDSLLATSFNGQVILAEARARQEQLYVACKSVWYSNATFAACVPERRPEHIENLVAIALQNVELSLLLGELRKAHPLA
jgi:hypothetical protein